ncbi:PREDICTED: TBC1 domain family member 25 isoform X1 [Nicrophorus vespilloides]|uniref:TBC1 domain family member 25 isoform X1 n=1 Tax=Nicrophorus vespilloides TaxID=110193 RepID=A0ABM1N2E3_NICVS|nr:PREDICTED: TBC1 domain family member 25 isoform X1 [Nicrophorus vespilloides]
MSGVFGFSREAIRVKVKKFEGNTSPEFRKFSVDPQITSFEVLQSILGKAFDIKGEFTICYRLFDANGHETYMPLLSDWDLDAAFIKEHNISLQTNTEPCLCLRVDLKTFEECTDEWELKPNNVPIITQIRNANSETVKSSPRLHGIFNQVFLILVFINLKCVNNLILQMGKTLNMVKGAFNFGEDGSSLQPPRPPLSDTEFRRFLDPVGQILHTKELRSVIYLGGIDHSLRKVVWKFILNVYPDGMTGKERMDYIKRKAAEYMGLKESWKKAIAQGPVVGELAYTTGMVRKDVLRTDRHHPFYAGSDDNQNIAALFNILTTYALNHPKVSYCQGMSDLASPLLVTMGDESHAYICFCALMQRLHMNFMIDGIAMTQKFTHLAEGLLFYDPEFYNYLKIHQADDLLFCYRWLLLEMKREFAFDDSLRMLEVLWSSLPAEPPTTELKLFDVQFQFPVITTPPISPLVKTPRENPYTKVCALRRQSSSISLVNYSGKKAQPVRRQNHSLDDSMCRSRSITLEKKHQSLDDNVIPKHFEFPKFGELRPRSVSPLEQKSDSVILNNRINQKIGNKPKSLSSSMSNLIKRQGHFRDLKEKLGMFASLDTLETTKEESEAKPAKMVKNLNEFLNFAKNTKLRPKIMLTKSSFDDSESSSFDKTSSRVYSSSCDDTFDECSPDDSQEYFPMTTSVTRELRIELENLDRQVFGNKYTERLIESPKKPEEVEKVNVFIWENPLHQSPNVAKNEFIHTPDEQADLDYDHDAQIVDEKTKTVTPIKIIHSTSARPHPIKLIEQCRVDPLQENGTTMMNSCEEVSEGIKSSGNLPSPKEFGGGNPFLMFLCITVLLQHRDHIIGKAMDYNEMAMHFDKMVRKHNVTKVLNQARQMYTRYIKQHNLAQQKVNNKEDC